MHIQPMESHSFKIINYISVERICGIWAMTQSLIARSSTPGVCSQEDRWSLPPTLPVWSHGFTTRRLGFWHFSPPPHKLRVAEALFQADEDNRTGTVFPHSVATCSVEALPQTLQAESTGALIPFSHSLIGWKSHTEKGKMKRSKREK